MTVKEFLILSEVAANPEEVKAQIEALPKPDFICGMYVPETLNDATMGQLIELQSVSTVADCLFVPCMVLLGLSKEKVSECRAEDVIGFSSWVAKEVDRINKLFESTSVEPTSEEKRAGIEQLKFGMFGLLDYFAVRMGITDHEDVERVPWVRVYKCLDMDAEKIRYERRLREVYQNKER